MSITLAIDAMGGDSAPTIVLEGLKYACKASPEVKFIVFGDKDLITDPILNDPDLKKCCLIRPTTEVVTSETLVSTALRSLKDSSMRLAIRAVAEGEAQGVVSAGNTGAYMALSKMVLKTLEGIDRPAIAALIPTHRGQCVALDLGANVEASPQNLVQFALMGSLFAQYVLGVEHPSIGLLNVGVEELKGHERLKIAQNLIRANPLIKNYVGYVEGDSIASNAVDVIVTDGFTGNIALKSMEGIATLLTSFLRQSILSSTLGKLGALLARNSLNTFKDHFNPHRYNGAPFLGLRGVAVKSHGGTNGYGFACAVKVAIDLVKHGITNKLVEDVAKLTNILDSNSTEQE